MAVLVEAEAAFRTAGTDRREEALADVFSAISNAYGALDVGRSPEASAHLAAFYDACLQAVGDAYDGDFDALAAAVTMARALESALRPASARPPASSGREPSQAPPSPRRMRRAA